MGKLNPVYEREGDWLLHRYEMESGKGLTLRARDVRQERTGAHALVQVCLGSFILASDVFNVGRDPDRVRLSNSALKMMGEFDRATWPDSHMKHSLDLFCLGLWDEHVGRHAAELMEAAETATVVRLCGSYVIKEGGTILFAPPGRGKSYTAMGMAVSMDAGCDAVWTVQQSRVLYVNLERSRDSMRFRLSRVNRALGLEATRPLPFLNARGRSLADVYDSVRRGIEEHGCDALVLDSISRTGVGDLTDNVTGNRAIDLLNGLGVAWLALGHTPRQAEDHVFGSQLFDAGMDIGVQLLTQSRNGTTGIGLKVTKANDMAIPPLQVLALEWDTVGLSALRPASAREFPELTGKRPLADEVADFLLLAGAMTGTEIAGELGVGRPKVAQVLANDNRFTVVRREGARVFYGVKTDT